MINLPLDQLREHPKQSEFFKPLEGKAWEEFYTDLNTRGIQQPLVISDRTGDFVIADGHQRARAAKHLGWLEVPCVMGEFANELEEVRCLVMNNVQRRQLSREELDNVIRYWLRNYTGHSNRRIADEIGVNHVTVEAKRQEMETGGEINHLDKLEGKDGKKYPRSQPKRKPETSVGKPYESQTEASSISYPKGNKLISPRAPLVSGIFATKEKGATSNSIPKEFKDEPSSYSESSNQQLQPESTLAEYTPREHAQPPGWNSTETRKELERAATILTRMDSDEGREELQRDRAGTLRPFLLSAYKQLGEMLEVTHDDKLITTNF